LFYSVEQVTPDIKEELDKQKGFVYNTRRGTAHFFSIEALVSFLERNGLSHVIRAHEVQEAGFQVRFQKYLWAIP
jgi:hypothetical protein